MEGKNPIFQVHLRPEDREMSCQFEDCPYKSAHAQKMKIHVAQVHNGEGARYCCHLCEKRFLRGHYLSKHLARSHIFRHPAGHSRFRYKLDDDGMFRVETIRFESDDLVVDVVEEEEGETEEDVDDVVVAENLVGEEQGQNEGEEGGDGSTMLVDKER